MLSIIMQVGRADSKLRYFGVDNFFGLLRNAVAQGARVEEKTEKMSGVWVFKECLKVSSPMFQDSIRQNKTAL
jgi:hypothetical protein